MEGSRAKSEYHRSHYVYFDFHNKTKGFQWHRAQILLDRLRENSVQGQYFRGVDLLGVIRDTKSTNCGCEKGLYGLLIQDKCCPEYDCSLDHDAPAP